MATTTTVTCDINYPTNNDMELPGGGHFCVWGRASYSNPTSCSVTAKLIAENKSEKPGGTNLGSNNEWAFRFDDVDTGTYRLEVTAEGGGVSGTAQRTGLRVSAF